MSIRNSALWIEPLEQFQDQPAEIRVMVAATAALMLGLGAAMFFLVLFSDRFYNINLPTQIKSNLGFLVALVVGVTVFTVLMPILRKPPIRRFIDLQSFDEQRRHQLFAWYHYETWVTARQILLRFLATLILVITFSRSWIHDLGGDTFEFAFLGSVFLWLPFAWLFEWQLYKRVKDIGWRLGNSFYLALLVSVVLAVTSCVTIAIDFMPHLIVVRPLWQPTWWESFGIIIATMVMGEFHSFIFRRIGRTIGYTSMKREFRLWQGRPTTS